MKNPTTAATAAFLHKKPSFIVASATDRRKYIIPATILVSMVVLLILFVSSISPPFSFLSTPFSLLSSPSFLESKLRPILPASTSSRLPRLAYLISGSSGDAESLIRTLLAQAKVACRSAVEAIKKIRELKDTFVHGNM